MIILNRHNHEKSRRGGHSRPVPETSSILDEYDSELVFQKIGKQFELSANLNFACLETLAVL